MEVPNGLKWPFAHSGFWRGAKYCMGAPRGNDFVFAPLGAAGGEPQGLSLHWLMFWAISAGTS